VAEDIYQLVMRKGPKPGEIFSLATPTAVLGRDPTCEVFINDAEVSRHHAKFVYSEAGYLVQDMGSTNGTFIEGKRLRGEPVLLTPGQTVIIGSNVVLVYEATMNTGDPLGTMVSAASDTQQIGRYSHPAQQEATILGEDAPEIEQPHISSAYIAGPQAAVAPPPPPPTPEPIATPAPEPVRPAPYTQPPPPPPYTPPAEPPAKNNTLYWVLGIGGVLLLCICCAVLMAAVYILRTNGGVLPF
jgi:pSer/pThr/pTyr-binding forkhead associated (FHA) protein